MQLNEAMSLMSKIMSIQSQLQDFNESQLAEILANIPQNTEAWKSRETLNLMESRINRVRERLKNEAARKASISYKDEMLAFQSMKPNLEEILTNCRDLGLIEVRFASTEEERKDFTSQPEWFYEQPVREMSAVKKFSHKIEEARAKLEKEFEQLSPNDARREHYLADGIKMYLLYGAASMYYAQVRVRTHPRVAVSCLYRAKGIFEVARLNTERLNITAEERDALLQQCHDAMSQLETEFATFQNKSCGLHKETLMVYKYAHNPFLDDNFMGDDSWNFLRLDTSITLPQTPATSPVVPSLGAANTPSLFPPAPAVEEETKRSNAIRGSCVIC